MKSECTELHALIVDDEPIMRRGLREQLCSLDQPFARITEATDGANALAIVSRSSYDVAFVDISMPRMDGLALAEAIARHHGITNLVIVTGFEQFDYAQRAIRAGAVDYLLKPVTDADLIKVLRRIEKRNRTAASDAAVFTQCVDALTEGVWIPSPERMETGLTFVEQVAATTSRSYVAGFLARVRRKVVDTVSQRLTVSVHIPTAVPDDLVKHMVAAFRGICSDIRKAVLDLRFDQARTSVERVKSYVRNRYSEDLSLDAVADYIGLSPGYLSRVFKEKTGTSFVQFRTETRVEKAKEFLSDPDFTIADVAVACGFKDAAHFGRVFRGAVGRSPGDYRTGLKERSS